MNIVEKKISLKIQRGGYVTHIKLKTKVCVVAYPITEASIWGNERKFILFRKFRKYKCRHKPLNTKYLIQINTLIFPR